MSTKSLLGLCLIVFFSFILMSNRQGRISASGNGATTAPGESGQTCGSIGCHFGGSFNTEASLTLLNTNDEAVNEYIPGQQYKIVVDASVDGSPAGYGFQIVALKNSDNSGLMGFSNFPDRVKEFIKGDRQYVEQFNRIATTPISFDWTAPAEGTGDVDFYAAVNAVNGNSNSSGDGADTVRLSIKEDLMSSTNLDAYYSEKILVWPNPASNVIYLDSEQEIQSVCIFNAAGQTLINRKYTSSEIDISQLDSGLYFLRSEMKTGNISVQKLIIN